MQASGCCTRQDGGIEFCACSSGCDKKEKEEEEEEEEEASDAVRLAGRKKKEKKEKKETKEKREKKEKKEKKEKEKRKKKKKMAMAEAEEKGRRKEAKTNCAARSRTARGISPSSSSSPPPHVPTDARPLARSGTQSATQQLRLQPAFGFARAAAALRIANRGCCSR